MRRFGNDPSAWVDEPRDPLRGELEGNIFDIFKDQPILVGPEGIIEDADPHTGAPPVVVPVTAPQPTIPVVAAPPSSSIPWGLIAGGVLVFYLLSRR